MAYLIYSKRTGVVKRLTHELGTVLPSEGVLDCPDNVANWSQRSIQPTTQDINTLGLAIFDAGGGLPTVDPVDDSGNPRPPLLHADAHADQVRLPITAIPQIWTAQQFLAAKYERFLAENYPYHVVIGEEFMDSQHVDAANSDNYVLTNGSCTLAPGGYIQTKAFSFRQKVYADYARFAFSVMWCQIAPAEVFGLLTRYDVSNDNSTWDGWVDLPRETHYAAIDDTSRGGTVAGPWEYVRFKIHNTTEIALSVDNLVVLLRAL